MEAPNIRVQKFFDALKSEAELIYKREPMLRSFLDQAILHSSGLGHSLGRMISQSLCCAEVGRSELFQVCAQAYVACPDLLDCAVCDITAVKNRDPASSSLCEIYLFLKGPKVLESWRIANWLYKQGRRELAGFIQSRISNQFTVDIHPAATIGRGIMLDHASGIVIGETAVIADTVSLLHDVTLGGTGKVQGDRHPKVGKGVMIGAGAKVLGNIHIGEGAIVGAGSVVLRDVPAHTTVVGVPARVVGHPTQQMPSLVMDQTLSEITTPIEPLCPILEVKQV